MIENIDEKSKKIDILLKKIFIVYNKTELNINDIGLIKYGINLVAKNLNFNHMYPVYGSNGVIGTLPTYEHRDYKISISCRGASSGNIILTEPKSTISSNSLYLDLYDLYSHMMPSILYSLINSGLNSFTTGSAQPQITIDNLKTLSIKTCDNREINNNALELIKLRSRFNNQKNFLNKIKASLLSKYF